MAGLKKAYLEITNLCNLSCSFCPGTRRPGGFLSPENFRILAQRLRPHVRYLYLHLMGEPLLHPDLDRLLEIAAQLKNHVDFHWFFVGDGRLLASNRELCRAMGLDECITFTGKLENPYPLMKRCDLFVLISEYEGTPVTIDEAKVLGLPVLANDVGGVADMLEEGMYGVILSGPNEAASQIIHWANQPCYTAPVNHQTQKPFMRELLINTILPQP